MQPVDTDHWKLLRAWVDAILPRVRSRDGFAVTHVVFSRYDWALMATSWEPVDHSGVRISWEPSDALRHTAALFGTGVLGSAPGVSGRSMLWYEVVPIITKTRVPGPDATYG